LNKGLTLHFAPLDDEHVTAIIDWREQDVAGHSLSMQLTMRCIKTAPKSDFDLANDARAIAVRFARAFADTLQDETDLSAAAGAQPSMVAEERPETAEAHASSSPLKLALVSRLQEQ